MKVVFQVCCTQVVHSQVVVEVIDMGGERCLRSSTGDVGAEWSEEPRSCSTVVMNDDIWCLGS